MIDSVHPLEEMKNQVALGANIKYVLIKLCEDAENEAAFRAPFCLSAEKLLGKTAQGVSEGLIGAPFYPSARKFPDGFNID